MLQGFGQTEPGHQKPSAVTAHVCTGVHPHDVVTSEGYGFYGITPFELSSRVFLVARL
jgi:hypothetical protein